MREISRLEVEASSQQALPSLKGPKGLFIDPGFQWAGWTVVALKKRQVLQMGLIRTHKESTKQKLLQADESFSRAREIAEALIEVVREHEPKIIGIESFSPPRHGGVSGKIGHAYGVLACLAVFFDLPVVSATPKQVRRAVDAATKDAVEQEVRRRFHSSSEEAMDRFTQKYSKNKANHTHAWDAVAVYEAVRRSEVVRALLQVV